MRARSLLYLFLALLGLPLQAAAAERAPAMFMTADVWPWGYHDEHGEAAGLISEFARRLGEVAGIPIENRIAPYPRLIRELRLGNVTFAVLFDNPTLDDFTRNLGPVLHSHLLFLSLERNQLQLSLAGLADKRVGYIRGTYYGQAFEQDQRLRKVAVSDLEQGLRMLMLGRLDAIMISETVLHHTLDMLALDIDRFVYSVHSQEHPANLYMFHQPDDPEQGERLRAALDQLRADGELEKLFQIPSRPAEGRSPELTR